MQLPLFLSRLTCSCFFFCLLLNGFFRGILKNRLLNGYSYKLCIATYSLTHSFLIDVIYMDEVSRLLHFSVTPYPLQTAENGGRDHISAPANCPSLDNFGFIQIILLRMGCASSKYSYFDYHNVRLPRKLWPN